MLINKKYLAQYSPLPVNYDVANLIPYVNVAEKIWIVKTIGQELYDELDKQVKDNIRRKCNLAYRRWFMAISCLCNAS